MVSRKTSVTNPQSSPRFPRDLALTCGLCGKTDRYHPGTVHFDLDVLEKLEESAERLGKSSSEEAFSFSAYFRCTGCRGGGPWRFPRETEGELVQLILGRLEGASDIPTSFGRLALFDGASFRYATESEAYLQGLIENDPGSASLQLRLGNVYRSGERPDLAVEPYRKGLELNPDDVELNLVLGLALWEIHEGEEAAPYLHQVLRRARHRIDVSLSLRRRMVASALRQLCAIHAVTEGAVDVFPPSERLKSTGGEAARLEQRSFDLSNPRDFDALCSVFLGERLDAGGVFAAPRPARNGPCPCGSGRKYKGCCGARKRRS